MKKFWNWLVSPEAVDYSGNSGYIYKRIITWLASITIIVVLFLWIYLTCNLLSGILTFLLVAGASTAGGAALGFLFGLPRSEKYRYSKKDDADHSSKDYSYGDNTNLEEVSDWVTKIIVGLTLIKLKTIIGWIDQSARSIDTSFSTGCPCPPCHFNAYVFGYCTIILYFLAGCGLCYLWTRTNLSLILTKSKKMQEEIERQQLIKQVQTLANPDMEHTDGITTNLKFEFLTAEQKKIQYPTASFRNLIENVYNAKPVFDKTDVQKGRWGGEAKKGDYILEAIYNATSMVPGLYKIQLVVRSLNPDNPVTGEAAFFLHDSFPSEIVYTVAVNNKTEITISAYEAFVAGARLENGVELELDLNKVKGFPEGFYWS